MRASFFKPDPRSRPWQIQHPRASVLMRTYLKAAVTAIASADKKAAEEAYKKVVPVLDSSATHGLISHNKAARHKTRMNAQIKAL